MQCIWLVQWCVQPPNGQTHGVWPMEWFQLLARKCVVFVMLTFRNLIFGEQEDVMWQPWKATLTFFPFSNN
jgi:hypothetical protein